MQTTPLAKAITTLEGQLVIASDVVLGVAAALPAHLISPQVAAIIAGAQHLALIVQRLVLKAQASKALAQIVQSPHPVAVAANALEHVPGVPAEQVQAGLAPEPEVTP